MRAPLSSRELLSLLALAALAACGGCERGVSPDAGGETILPPGVPPEIQVVQALLDSPWIQNAVEPEGAAPPLVVVVPAGLRGAPLRAFGKPVQVLSPAEVQAQRPEAYLEVTLLRLEGDRAVVVFRDDAKGVSGEAQLQRGQNGWRVAQVTGQER